MRQTLAYIFSAALHIAALMMLFPAVAKKDEQVIELPEQLSVEMLMLAEISTEEAEAEPEPVHKPIVKPEPVIVKKKTPPKPKTKKKLDKKPLLEKREKELLKKKALLKKKENQRLRKLVEQRRREWHQRKAREKLEAEKERQHQVALQKQRKKIMPKASPAKTKVTAKVMSAPKINHNPAYQSRKLIEYPRNARRRNVQGTVVLRASISTNGRVQKVWIHKSSGHSILDSAAMHSVPQWVFKPAQHGGKAVTSTVQFPVVFKLK